MRMGPFSNTRVTDFINQHYVPLFVSNEEYRSGKAGTSELNALRTIRKNASSNGLSSGSVQVYIVTADLDVADTLHVAKASNTGTLMKMLVANAKRLESKAGERLIPLRRLSKAPATSDSQLALRIAAKFKQLKPIVGENWIVLEKNEWTEFAPQDAELGRKWTINPSVAEKILGNFYPYAPNWDVTPKDELSAAEITAEIVKNDNSELVLILRGTLLMKRYVYETTGRSDVRATLAGYVTIKPNEKPNIVLVPTKAIFAGREFDGLIHSE